jgi:hypothetical protein
MSLGGLAAVQKLGNAKNDTCVRLTFLACDVLLLAEFDEIRNASVVGFFAGFCEETAGNFSGVAMISHAFAAKPAFGTTVGAGAIF